MRLTNFTVSFKRSKQPASYETSEPQVSLTGAFDDDEPDAESRLRDAMLSAVRVVYNTLAMDVPTGIVEKLGAVDQTDTHGPVETGGAPAAKRGPGRPRGSTRGSTSKEAEAAKAAVGREEAPMSADLNAREADAKLEPAKEPETATEAPETVTDAALMSLVTKASASLGAKVVKALLAEMPGVSRVGEMDQAQRRQFRDMLKRRMDGEGKE